MWGLGFLFRGKCKDLCVNAISVHVTAYDFSCILYLILIKFNLRTRTKSPSRGSSGSIVSDYGLDDRVVEVRSPTGAEDFSSSPCVQTGSGAHPASYPMGTGGPFPGGKARQGRDADHSPQSSGRG
jgi:hypothetical protein